MAPAPLAADLQQDQQLKTLARGFEALLLINQQLSSKEKALEERLKYAHDEYLKLSSRLPDGFDTHTKIVSEKIIGRHFEFEAPQKHASNPLEVVKNIEESGNVGDSSLTAITAGLECYKSVLNLLDHSQSSDISSCLVATRAGSLEKDFTTKGTRGSLRCPFAKSHNKTSENGVTNGIENPLPTLHENGDTCGHEGIDPIKAERHDRRSSQAPSARTSTTQCPISRCPIRFLNEHSPEEIADYVERHKHEIPRSHAICVKRYSKDSRQMDAKYGSLINMIQGLSEKHQAFLPGQSRSSAPTASSSAERVEKWAEEVGLNPKMQTSKEDDEVQDQDAREGHFDRPLREVRVGESPSRPWGIHVPITQQPKAVSPPHSPVNPVPTTIKDQLNENIVTDATPVDSPSNQARPVGRCPFGHGGGVPPPGHPAIDTEPIRKPEKIPETSGIKDYKETKPENPPEISCAPQLPTGSVVFNGPVFFGFSPEQTTTFIQQLANMGMYKP